ncbi:hypothetical protein BH10PSE12_BH10PSE12_05500 [soil metagenome]
MPCAMIEEYKGGTITTLMPGPVATEFFPRSDVRLPHYPSGAGRLKGKLWLRLIKDQ